MASFSRYMSETGQCIEQKHMKMIKLQKTEVRFPRETKGQLALIEWRTESLLGLIYGVKIKEVKGWKTLNSIKRS